MTVMCRRLPLWVIQKEIPDVREDVSLKEAQDAYHVVNLEDEKEKRQDRTAQCVEWGTEVNGLGGWAGAPGPKLLQLMHITLEALRVPFVEKKLFETLLGPWGPVLMHRRPAMCLSDDCYRFLQRLSLVFRFLGLFVCMTSC